MTKASELAHLAAIILAPNLIGFLESKAEGDRQKHEVRDEAVKMAVRTAAAVMAAAEDFQDAQRHQDALSRIPAGSGIMSAKAVRPGDEAVISVRARPQDSWRV